MKIYQLTLDIKNPDVPFTIEKSISTSSGDLIIVFSQFQLQLVQLLRELHEENLKEQLALHGLNDDIPF